MKAVSELQPWDLQMKLLTVTPKPKILNSNHFIEYSEAKLKAKILVFHKKEESCFMIFIV